VTRSEELTPALEAALQHDGPTVLDVVTDVDAMAPTAFVYDSALA
jgi:thiamine pyrophosphate-dependent acetolactate synthase large subunit-like protein